MIHIELILNKSKISEPVFQASRHQCIYYHCGICKFYTDKEHYVECRYLYNCNHFGFDDFRNLPAPIMEFSGEHWQWIERATVLNWIKENEGSGLFEKRELKG